MSTTIYIIRHGQSMANKLDVFLGHHNMDLTEQGRQQARRTAAFLEDIRPDVIYSSDLTRAYQTAEPTAEFFGLPIIKEPRLREIFAGEWEDVPFLTIAEKYPESFRTWRDDIGYACPDGGESVMDLQKRVVQVVTEIAKKHPDQTVFIFTHATSLRVFAAHVMNKTRGEVKDVPWAPNASVSKVVYDGEKFSLVEYGRDDFMGEIGTRLPPDIC